MQKLQEKYSLQSLILNQVHLIHQVWQQKESEYTKIAYCHKQLFDAIKGLKQMVRTFPD